VVWDNSIGHPVTGTVYLDLLQEFVGPRVEQMFGDAEIYFQRDGAPPHYHREVRGYHDTTLPDSWIGQRGSIEYPAHSTDLTPMEIFFTWIGTR
jgi:hypothetical protein